MQEKKYEIPVIFRENVCRRRLFTSLHTFTLLDLLRCVQIAAAAENFYIISSFAEAFVPAAIASDCFHKLEILVEARK